MVTPIVEIVNQVLNGDAQYAKSPLELRNQRTYAVKVNHIFFHSIFKLNDFFKQSGVNGFLDVGRQAYKEASEDAYFGVQELSGT